MFPKTAVLVFVCLSIILCIRPATAQGLETVDIGLQGKPYFPIWDLPDMEGEGAIGPELSFSLQIDDGFVREQVLHGPFLSGGFLYVNGEATASSEDTGDVSRYTPIIMLGYSIFIVTNRMDYYNHHGPVIRAAATLTKGGFGAEVDLLYQWTTSNPEFKIFGGVTGGYLQTGVDPSDTEIRFPFMGACLGSTYDIDVD